MLYFKMVNGKCEGISTVYGGDDTWTCRSDYKGFDAVAIAAAATKFSGDTYLSTDAGPNVSPRFDVIRAPKKGDKISYGFNGDYYPDGEIVAVSKTFKVVTSSTGARYYRRRNTACWMREGGTWAMVAGHVNARNPSF